MHQIVKEPPPLERPGSASPSRGVRPLNERARRMERRVTLLTVLLPYAGLAGAIAVFWRRGINWTDLGVFSVMYALTVLGIGMGFHRLMAHRAFQAATPFKLAMIILASIPAPEPGIFSAPVH